MSFQTFVCGGNLTADPEMKYVRETPKTSFSIAVNKRTREGEKTLYIDIETWDKLAESVAEHKRKGDYVVVIGEWDMDEWEDGDGKKRRKWFVRGRDVRFEGPRSERRDDDRPRRSREDDDRPPQRRSRDRDDERPRRGRDDEDRDKRDARYDDLPF